MSNRDQLDQKLEEILRAGGLVTFENVIDKLSFVLQEGNAKEPCEENVEALRYLAMAHTHVLRRKHRIEHHRKITSQHIEQFFLNRTYYSVPSNVKEMQKKLLSALTGDGVTTLEGVLILRKCGLLAISGITREMIEYIESCLADVGIKLKAW